MSFTTSQYEAEPVTINGSHRPAPTGPRLTRRERWVPIDDEDTAEEEKAYSGFKVKLWVNYPRHLIIELRESDDAEVQKKILTQMVVAHNGWVNIDGEEFPPANDPAFWEQIPDELAGALIALVNRESSKLAASVRQRSGR